MKSPFHQITFFYRENEEKIILESTQRCESIVINVILFALNLLF